MMDVVADIFRDKAIEDGAKDIGLEFPAIDAASQVVGYLPDGLMQFSTFSLI